MASVSVNKLRARAKLSQQSLANLLGTSSVSVSRWERSVAKPGPETQARIKRLRQLVDRIGGALPAEELPTFLQTPQPLLRGYWPADLLQSGYAFEDRLAFVESAKSGDMV